MRFLADENLDSLVVRWLRERGHDVIWMVDLAPGAIDSDVLARTADRVLLTQDRDFGRMVFLEGAAATGIVYLRIRSTSPSTLVQALARLWPVIEAKSMGHFLVVTNDRVRIRPLGR